MEELRCEKCNKLLATYIKNDLNTLVNIDTIKLEIKCTRCKKLNKFNL